MARGRANAAEKEARVDQVLELLLASTPYSAILRFAAEKWQISPRQTDNYIADAKERLAEIRANDREANVKRHIALRRMIQRRALAKDDLKTALRAADSEAKLDKSLIERVEVKNQDPWAAAIEELNESLAEMPAAEEA